MSAGRNRHSRSGLRRQQVSRRQAEKHMTKIAQKARKKQHRLVQKLLKEKNNGK